ncbi:MAG: type III pantothenate kinase [Phycisphaerae bacterium]|nr:type III pantothenate kinase [Phycisphaerae bacterium]NIP52840.1 type III pantothenate kinase [Phycisphaerae bacterium]NIS51861.1 type III pantothenate kinase [Phycisphaerae bacterium]NIU09379.1 type III pantothenate kinase [Phycisphaerae bacterium]NIU57612.1 type III pantothenate kinase [Phycisphaerae bacterium]
MNIIAVDIGNTNITTALYLKDEEQFIKSVSGRSRAKLTELFKSAWEKIPVAESSKEGKRDGVIVVCSVKPAWTQLIRKIAKDNLDERLYVIGQDLPLPMSLWVDEPQKVGVDRVVSAAAAYAVIKDAVVVADFGTAVTIDLVDDNGVFLGGVICPGLEISARALKEYTAQLPKAKVTRPKAPYGKNTTEAINCGLYYSAVATLQEVIRRYAESIGKWPHTVLTGSAAEIIKKDCDYIDSYVPGLVVKGIVLAYKKYIEEKMEQVI